jgi:hypothetical protein
MILNSITKFFAAALLLGALALASVRAGETVPYKGAATGNVTGREDLNGGIPIPGGPLFRRVTLQAKGNFTHVGRATIDFIQEMRLVIENGVPYFLVEGSYIVTAASGDTLFGTYTTKQNVITNEFVTDVFAERGAGRFEGVSGEIPGAGQFYPATDTFDYALDGFITTVGSSKRHN